MALRQCGKSTLLTLMNGCVPERGTVRWIGEALTQAQLKQLPRFRGAYCCSSIRKRCCSTRWCARKSPIYAGTQLGRADVDAQIGHWAAELRIAHLLDKARVAHSGGEQKVASVALDPALLLLDRRAPASIQRRSAGRHPGASATVVASTHSLSLAAELGSRCIVLGKGGAVDGPRAWITAWSCWKNGPAHRHSHRHGGAEPACDGHDWRRSSGRCGCVSRRVPDGPRPGTPHHRADVLRRSRIDDVPEHPQPCSATPGHVGGVAALPDLAIDRQPGLPTIAGEILADDGSGRPKSCSDGRGPRRVMSTDTGMAQASRKPDFARDGSWRSCSGRDRVTPRRYLDGIIHVRMVTAWAA